MYCQYQDVDKILHLATFGTKTFNLKAKRPYSLAEKVMTSLVVNR